MTRILFIDSAPFCGGAQESLLTLARELSSRSQSLLLFCADTSLGGLAQRAEAAGLAVRTFSCRHWPASSSGLLQYYQDRRKFAPVWETLLQEYQPQIIIANGLRAALLAYRLQLAGAPLVLHDRDLRCPPLLPRILAGLAGVIAISQAVSEKWQKVLSPERLFVLHNGFDLASLSALLPAHPSREQTFRIILVADFVPWKRHRLFLESLVLLQACGFEWQALIRGRTRSAKEEKYRRRIVNLAERLGLAGRLSFSHCPGSAISDIAKADLLLSCAENEPFGRTLIEALALGKPVIAVEGGGVEEILAGCRAARICPPVPTALATAIQESRAHAAKPELKLAAQKHAAKFSCARYAEQFLAICHRILTKAIPPPGE